MTKNSQLLSSLQDLSLVKYSSDIWVKIQDLSGKSVKFTKITTFWFIYPTSSMDTSTYLTKKNFISAVGTTISVLMLWSNNSFQVSKLNFTKNTSIPTFFISCRIFYLSMTATPKFSWKNLIRLIIKALLKTHLTTRKRKNSPKLPENTLLTVFSKKLFITMLGLFIDFCLFLSKENLWKTPFLKIYKSE